jgi:hypothetical protein
MIRPVATSCFGRKVVEMSSMELDDRCVNGVVHGLESLSRWALSASGWEMQFGGNTYLES